MPYSCLQVVNLHGITFKLFQNNYLFTGQCKWYVSFVFSRASLSNKQ